MTCQYCKGPLPSDNPKAKFCSNKCRVYAARGIKFKPNLMKQIPNRALSGGEEEDEKVEKPRVLGRAEKPWLSPESLKHQPVVLEKGMPKSELMKYLVGGREYCGVRSGGIRGYNEAMLAIGMPWRCTTVQALEVMLAKSGYDPKLAQGVGYEPPASEFLARVRENEKKSKDTSQIPD